MVLKKLPAPGGHAVKTFPDPEKNARRTGAGRVV